VEKYRRIFEEDSIGYKKYFEFFFFAQIQKLSKLWVHERLSHQMKSYEPSDFRNLRNDLFEGLQFHHPLGANHFRAKTALEITDIGNLNIYFSK
jgi:hypothetical protein